MEEGLHGEVWQFENNISDLIELCSNVLSDNPLFFLINSYTTGISAEVLSDLLRLNLKKYNGKITSGEIGLPMKDSNLILPCGIFGKWEKYNYVNFIKLPKKYTKTKLKVFVYFFLLFINKMKKRKHLIVKSNHRNKR